MLLAFPKLAFLVTLVEACPAVVVEVYLAVVVMAFLAALVEAFQAVVVVAYLVALVEAFLAARVLAFLEELVGFLQVQVAQVGASLAVLVEAEAFQVKLVETFQVASLLVIEFLTVEEVIFLVVLEEMGHWKPVFSSLV